MTLAHHLGPLARQTFGLAGFGEERIFQDDNRLFRSCGASRQYGCGNSIQRGRIYKGRSAPASALTDYCWILDRSEISLADKVLCSRRDLFFAFIPVRLAFRAGFEPAMQPHILLRRHHHGALNRSVHLRGHRRFIASLQRIADIFQNNQLIPCAICFSARYKRDHGRSGTFTSM